jgi:hypothetical protein
MTGGWFHFVSSVYGARRSRSSPDHYKSARKGSDKSGDKLGDKLGDNLGDNLGDGFLFAFGIKGLAKPPKKMVNGRR